MSELAVYVVGVFVTFFSMAVWWSWTGDDDGAMFPTVVVSIIWPLALFALAVGLPFFAIWVIGCWIGRNMRRHPTRRADSEKVNFAPYT